MTLIMITPMVELRAAQTQDIMAFRWEQNTQMVKYQVKNQKIYELGMRSKKGHMIRKVRKVCHNILQRRKTSIDFPNSWLLRGERSFILILVPKHFRFHKKLN